MAAPPSHPFGGPFVKVNEYEPGINYYGFFLKIHTYLSP
jgi:hypothetical protein